MSEGLDRVARLVPDAAGPDDVEGFVKVLAQEQLGGTERSQHRLQEALRKMASQQAKDKAVLKAFALCLYWSSHPLLQSGSRGLQLLWTLWKLLPYAPLLLLGLCLTA